jgi:hypothetical protein
MICTYNSILHAQFQCRSSAQAECNSTTRYKVQSGIGCTSEGGSLLAGESLPDAASPFPDLPLDIQ